MKIYNLALYTYNQSSGDFDCEQLSAYSEEECAIEILEKLKDKYPFLSNNIEIEKIDLNLSFEKIKHLYSKTFSNLNSHYENINDKV